MFNPISGGGSSTNVEAIKRKLEVTRVEVVNATQELQRRGDLRFDLSSIEATALEFKAGSERPGYVEEIYKYVTTFFEW